MTISLAEASPADPRPRCRLITDAYVHRAQREQLDPEHAVEALDRVRLGHRHRTRRLRAHATPASITEFCDRLTERLRAVPGARAVSITEIYPPSDRWREMFSIEGRPVSRLEDIPSAVFGVVDANYLRTAGIALVRGRDFSESDGEKTLPVAIFVPLVNWKLKSPLYVMAPSDSTLHE